MNILSKQKFHYTIKPYANSMVQSFENDYFKSINEPYNKKLKEELNYKWNIEESINNHGKAYGLRNVLKYRKTKREKLNDYKF